jgi:hypothetical protein
MLSSILSHFQIFQDSDEVFYNFIADFSHDYEMFIMKKAILVINLLIILTACLSAQKGKHFTVPAGKKVEDCIPFEERFRFPEFTTGRVFFTQGTSTEAKLNYNFLTREMAYIQNQDTLDISNPSDIKQIIIDGNIFIMNKGYMEVISNTRIPVGIRQYFNMIDERKKDPYGDMAAGAATTSYNSLHTDGAYYKLTQNHDRLFQKVAEYYLATSSSGFVAFTKKKVLQLFPQKKKEIQAYLKSNNVDFDSREDLIRFSEYLSGF